LGEQSDGAGAAADQKALAFELEHRHEPAFAKSSGFADP
jgi:hypothetical protein